MSDSTDDAVYATLREFVSADNFVCLGARAALRRATIVHRHYPEFAPGPTVARHHHDVLEFLDGFEPSARSFTSFVATFAGPLDTTETGYERLIWEYLQALHDLDSRTHPWTTLYDSDPASTGFAFSVGSHPFFVVGLHSGASRPSRRFPMPALVFNSHVQFNAMGMNFLKMRSKIRIRERAFHGAINPSFAHYKDEARHYSGRFTEPDWKCPFHPSTE